MSFHILVVDNEQDTASLFQQKFSKQIHEEHYRFSFIHHGVEALTLVHNDPSVDLVLTDINLPGINGLELIGHINRQGLKAILVTAYGDIDNIRHAMNQGAYDFCTKPIDFLDLSQTIERALIALQQSRESQKAQDALRGLHQELLVSSQLQRSIIPKEFPFHPSIELYGQMTAALEIGGDFYDFFWLDSTHLALAIADISGKNISAALYMAIVRTLLKSMAYFNHEPDLCIQKVNTSLCQDNASSMFVTLFYGVLNAETRELCYVNAGHCGPLILRRQGLIERLSAPTDLALGLKEDTLFTARTITLHPLDTCVLFTDGIIEALNQTNEEYGEERLLACVQQHATLPLQPFIETLIKDVQIFADSAPQSDDLTLVALRIKQPPSLLVHTVSPEIEGIPLLLEKVETFCQDHHTSSELSFHITLVLDELTTNILSYGYPAPCPPSDKEILITLEVQAHTLVVILKDNAIPFNPLEYTHPDTTASLEKRPIGGLGLYFARTFMDRLHYAYQDNHNILRIELDLKTHKKGDS